ncbi:histidinol-phosphate aminotransferase family protein [Christensenellaceae bacterium OttesenSCG-928-L17]|nr:histidinol-phosphate aminotransferase family protein [Christensenellaceae bacterium OttesenSCG-928-L17]
MLRINSRIQRQTKLSYATEGDIYEAYTLDCGEGINTMLQSERVRKTMRTFTEDMVRAYPHGTELKERICALWKENAAIQREQVLLTDGSMSALYLINRLFLEPSDRALGYCPQFAEYGTDVRTYCTFDTVRLREERNYQFDANEFCAALRSAHKLVYIDNPNNPTGQIIPLSDIKMIVERAHAQDTVVVVDEAYGEYMEPAQSAVNLMDMYNNLIVVRSFSKGYGLAGLRAGYMLMPEALSAPVSKIANPYAMGTLARKLACACLDDAAFLKELRTRTATMKKQMLQLPLENITFAHTAQSVSISMLRHADYALDLAAAFADAGILVVPGVSFQELRRNSVRLRLPAEENFPRLMESILAIDKL